jgi:hypothetical protein
VCCLLWQALRGAWSFQTPRRSRGPPTGYTCSCPLLLYRHRPGSLAVMHPHPWQCLIRQPLSGWHRLISRPQTGCPLFHLLPPSSGTQPQHRKTLALASLDPTQCLQWDLRYRPLAHLWEVQGLRGLDPVQYLRCPGLLPLLGTRAVGHRPRRGPGPQGLGLLKIRIQYLAEPRTHRPTPHPGDRHTRRPILCLWRARYLLGDPFRLHSSPVVGDY